MVLDALFYRLRNAGPWRDLPDVFGPWRTIYGWYQRLTRQGIWERLLRRLAGHAKSKIRLVHGTHVVVHQCAANPAGGAQKQAMGRTRRLGPSQAQRLSATQRNQVWSWDFVMDQTESGGAFRILTLIDEHTRQCLATHVAWSIRATDVLTVLEQAIHKHGTPEHMRSDNGPSSSRMPSRTGSQRSTSRRSTSSPVRHGKTDTLNHSTTSCATSVLTEKSLARWRKPA